MKLLLGTGVGVGVGVEILGVGVGVGVESREWDPTLVTVLHYLLKKTSLLQIKKDAIIVIVNKKPP